jgi:hypothetical protein
MVTKYGLLLGCFISLNLAIELTISPGIRHYLIPFSNMLSMLIIAGAYLLEASAQNLKSAKFLRRGFRIGLIGALTGACAFFLYYETIGNNYYEQLMMYEVAKLKLAGYDEWAVRRAIAINHLVKKIHIKEISIFLSSTIKFFAIVMILSAFVESGILKHIKRAT